jgi:hypothetical protein
MTLATLIERAYVLASGKATAPGTTTNKYLRLKSLANICQDMWQNEPDVDWSSLYETVTLSGTVTATDTFDLGTSIRKISNRDGDYVKIVCTDGQEVYFDLIKPERLLEYSRNGINACAKVGNDLKFAIPFTADSHEFGGVIKVPAYGYVSTLTNTTDLVQVDNPLWLCYMVAAEYCRTDTTLNYRTDDLVARANQEMTAMKQNQESAVNQPIMYPLGLSRTW